MRLLIAIFACFLVFSAATFCLADSAETPNQADVNEVEEAQKDQDADSLDKDDKGSDKKGGEELSGDPALLSLGAERRISERIRRISEESQRRERPGYVFSCALGYADHGVDEILPEHFFRGHVTSQGVSFSHRVGFRVSLENFTSVDGGGFSDLVDRTVLDVKVWREFGSLYGAVQHRWVHTNYKMDEDFFFADRHRTAVRFGFLLGPLQPYAFISSDIPAYVPVNEMAVYGGGGVDLRCNIRQLNTELYLGASAAGSLFLHNQKDGAALYRVRTGFATSLGGLVINPEAAYLRGVFNSDNLLTTTFKIAF